MTKFIATSHQAQITVEYTERIDSLTIVIDECPNIDDPENGLFQNLDIPLANVPALINALTKAYEHVSGEQP